MKIFIFKKLKSDNCNFSFFESIIQVVAHKFNNWYQIDEMLLLFPLFFDYLDAREGNLFQKMY